LLFCRFIRCRAGTGRVQSSEHLPFLAFFARLRRLGGTRFLLGFLFFFLAFPFPQRLAEFLVIFREYFSLRLCSASPCSLSLFFFPAFITPLVQNVYGVTSRPNSPVAQTPRERYPSSNFSLLLFLLHAPFADLHRYCFL